MRIKDSSALKAVRRFLVLQSLLIWQGGFLFYASFVVPVGTEVLGTAARQGAITFRVAEYLNLCGVIGLSVISWDIALRTDTSLRRTAARWWSWMMAGICQYLLCVLHLILGSCLDAKQIVVVIQPPFAPLHGAYLWISTIQWIACLTLAWWTLRAWQEEDSIESDSRPNRTSVVVLVNPEDPTPAYPSAAPSLYPPQPP